MRARRPLQDPRQGAGRQERPDAPARGGGEGSPAGLPIPGACALSVAAGSALVLVLDHLGALRAPGCGPASACARAAAGPLGTIPVLGWPVSFAGLAWFAALLAAWLATGGRADPGLRVLARAGAAVSLLYLGALLGERLLCPWCIAAHAGSLAFWALVERAPRASRRISRPAVAAGTFAAATLLLALARTATRSGAREEARRELAASVGEIGAAPARPSGFAGRHLLGSASARARIVAFTDYQCPDCRTIEEDLQRAVAGSAEACLSIKHLPLCSACNPRASDLHPNACWAARAAEAAGLVAGSDGFWRAHRWLFARGGAFTEAELREGLAGLGLESGAFLRAMHSDEALARVRADVDEALSLGVSSTPAVFVNGVLLRGWNAPGAVARAVAAAIDAVHAGGAGAGAAGDRPPPAREKLLDDWRLAPEVLIPVDLQPRALGPEAARVRVVLFGDYQEPFTAQADLAIRRLLLARGDVRYVFRHWPANPDCNPFAKLRLHERACLAALAAEAAHAAGGDDVFWTMHDWLMTHPEGLDHERIVAAGVEIGLDREAYWKALLDPAAMGAILEDAAAGDRLGLGAIPMILVNEKPVAAWKAGEEDLLPAIVEEASRP